MFQNLARNHDKPRHQPRRLGPHTREHHAEMVRHRTRVTELGHMRAGGRPMPGWARQGVSPFHRSDLIGALFSIDVDLALDVSSFDEVPFEVAEAMLDLGRYVDGDDEAIERMNHGAAPDEVYMALDLVEHFASERVEQEVRRHFRPAMRPVQCSAPVARVRRQRARRTRAIRTVAKKAASSSSGDGDPERPPVPARLGGGAL